VKYTANALGPDTVTVELRFMQGRADVARAAVAREGLQNLLGERNRSAIERHLANDADKYLAVVSGEPRGQRLHYQEVTIPTPEPRMPDNSIAQTQTRERRGDTAPKMAHEAREETPQKDNDPAQQSQDTDTRDEETDDRAVGELGPIAVSYDGRAS
jgi:hypothetical protein